ncbi:MAG: phage baseplate assembly protein V [Deltaproteobacteria bacterium]|nr:phage baseplate assembly protein V [Deltaproteobacteria bacterium]
MRAGGPRRDSLDLQSYGLHYGVVCKNQDDEQQLGRVKVTVPWLDGQDETHWAQLLTPMEGKEYGWYNVPEIGDVVVVMFIGGDFSQPVIIGGVWSTPDASPEPNEDGKNNFRGYRSRSGHRLLFDDSAKTKVVLSDKSGKMMMGIGNFAKDGAGPNTCAVLKPKMTGDTGVAFSSMEGNLEITCKAGTLTVTATNIKINSLKTTDVDAGSTATFEGSSMTKLTAGSPTSLDAPQIKIG